MVELRLDRRLRSRLDSSDVLQEAYIQAQERLDELLRKPAMPMFIWLRLLTAQKLVDIQRHHLGAKLRDPRREVSLYTGPVPRASSESLAAQLLGQQPTPSSEAIKAERVLRLEAALNDMDATDREVLALRHFEELSSLEVSQVLGIQERAGSKRYVRALKKLQDLLRKSGGW